MKGGGDVACMMTRGCRTAGYMQVVLYYAHSLQMIQTRREQSCVSAMQLQLQK